MGETDHKKRLVAILAADAAGYSRLMAADEAATVAALDAARAVFRSQIGANHGRVIDMAGDSVLSVFELATGAVSAALAIQQELKAAANDVSADRRMRFRIGVHLGEIIEKDDGTIYGDGVNIAARLEALAEPGGVTVSESVRTAVRGKVTAAFEDKGEQIVKNIAHWVRAFAVRAAGDAAAKAAPAAGDIESAAGRSKTIRSREALIAEPDVVEAQSMRRRDFLAAICGAIATLPSLARAQPSRIPRVGVLWHAGSAAEEGSYYTGLLEGFRDLGYVDGRNIILEHRFPNEMPERFRSMVAELVALKLDVLVTVGTQTAPYARNATTSIPVVFIFVPDPVGSGFVDSLARPGRNMTGLSHFGKDLVLKRLQFLKDLIPGLSRVGLLVNPNTEVATLYKRVTDTAAVELGLENQTFEARSLEELGRAFDAMGKAGMQAVTINGEGLVYQQRAAVANMALARRLPLAVWSRETFEAGALMSYGTDQVAMCRRGPVFVDKILKGAKPGDLPVEQPTKLEFLINRKVATALGLTIPPVLLVRADQVIE